MKILLLENIHTLARDLLIRAGHDVTLVKTSLSGAALVDQVKQADVLGIRSKTLLTAEVLNQCQHLQAIGCFCVGTNQVDVNEAQTLGIPVFNAPYSNTRSVAEMVICEIIMLARKIGMRNSELHEGLWNKKSDGCFEIRGKTLGIVGYGNIGTQVSHLAESFGMRVIFYDVISKLGYGNAVPKASLDELLEESDFVTLHVPESALTQGMIGADELNKMKPEAYLINASRGTVVNLEALQSALVSKKLSGAALDVFPIEPEANGPGFKSPLQKLDNVILTPHIGGATEEAQGNIGREVAETLIRYLASGSTRTCVNMPVVDLPVARGGSRVLNIHQNVPGVLREINRIISESGANILAEHLATDPKIGYLLIDVDGGMPTATVEAIQNLKTSIRTRVL